MYFNGVVGYAWVDPVEGPVGDVVLELPVGEAVGSVVDGAVVDGAVVELSVGVSGAAGPGVPDASGLEVSGFGDSGLEVSGVELAVVSPAGFGSAVPPIVVAQPVTSTAASAAAAAVHLVRLIDQSFSAELGLPARDAGYTVNGSAQLLGAVRFCDVHRREIVPGRA